MLGQVSLETSQNATPFCILIAGTENGRGSERLPSATPSVSRSKLTKRDKIHIDESSLDNPDPGLFLSRGTITSGDNPNVALDCATKSIERCLGPDLELAMSLHVLASIYTNMGRFEKAVLVLDRSIEVPVLGNGSDHALAKFSGCMHIGDKYSMMGQLDQSIKCDDSGLRIQIEALGDLDPRVADTCRYLAEAHVKAMQFAEAQNLSKQALEIHNVHSAPTSLEDAADHWLMALVCEAKADNESVLEHLVLTSMSTIANGQENESAAIDISIYLSLCRFDEAIFAYQKALAVFKSTKGKNHPFVATVFIRLNDLYYKIGKRGESKFYSENSLRIYSKPVTGTTSEEIVSLLTEVLGIYEGLNGPEEALKFLENTMMLLEDTDGNRSTIAGIEALMSVMFYLVGRYGEGRSFFNSAVENLHASGETNLLSLELYSTRWDEQMCNCTE